MCFCCISNKRRLWSACMSHILACWVSMISSWVATSRRRAAFSLLRYLYLAVDEREPTLSAAILVAAVAAALQFFCFQFSFTALSSASTCFLTGRLFSASFRLAKMYSAPLLNVRARSVLFDVPRSMPSVSASVVRISPMSCGEVAELFRIVVHSAPAARLPVTLQLLHSRVGFANHNAPFLIGVQPRTATVFRPSL